MRRRKSLILAVALVLALFTATAAGAAIAITMFSQTLAGIGSAAFTNEVTVGKIKVESLSKVRVRLFPTLNAVAARVYTVELYGDDELLGTNTVSFTAPEIAAGTKKDVTFTGLALAGVTILDVDVVY